MSERSGNNDLSILSLVSGSSIISPVSRSITCIGSNLMWAHYADQNRGICVEYDMDKCNNSTDISYLKTMLLPVSCLIALSFTLPFVAAF